MFYCALRRHLSSCSVLAARRVWFTSTCKPRLALQEKEFLPPGSEQDTERVARLEVQVREARHPRARSSYRTAVKSEERLGPDGTFRCSSCQELKVPDSFYADARCKFGYTPICRICSRAHNRHYFVFTLRGIMTTILHNARRRALQRCKIPFCQEAGQFDLSVDSMLDLWGMQRGRCEYSGMVMSLIPYTSWRLSLERLDNNLGYVSGNVAFICIEFNTGFSQWSKKKVQSLPHAIECAGSMPVSGEELLFNSRVETTRSRKTKRDISHAGLLLCTSCRQLKSAVDDFHTDTRNRIGKKCWCKQCQAIWQARYTQSFQGFLRTRLLSAKWCARKRTMNGRTIAGEFGLTMADLFSMYQQQCGLCFYSGVKLCLQSNSEWMCSIERLDNNKGYIRSNVALICAEFQSTDYSHCAKVPVQGSAQWSREKVKMVVQWLRRNPK